MDRKRLVDPLDMDYTEGNLEVEDLSISEYIAICMKLLREEVTCALTHWGKAIKFDDQKDYDCQVEILNTIRHLASIGENIKTTAEQAFNCLDRDAKMQLVREAAEQASGQEVEQIVEIPGVGAVIITKSPDVNEALRDMGFNDE